MATSPRKDTQPVLEIVQDAPVEESGGTGVNVEVDVSVSSSAFNYLVS